MTFPFTLFENSFVHPLPYLFELKEDGRKTNEDKGSKSEENFPEKYCLNIFLADLEAKKWRVVKLGNRRRSYKYYLQFFSSSYVFVMILDFQFGMKKVQ
jgi:hypothetical protein